MTTTDHIDPPDLWTTLAADWQATRPRPSIDVAQLAARVHAHRRRMLWLVAAEVVLSIGVVAFGLYALASQRGPLAIFLVADSWLLLAIAWAFAIWNRRSTWRPATETVEAYLELSRTRCQRQLRAVWFTIGVIVLQLVAAVLWRVLGGEAMAAGPVVRSWALIASTLVVAGYLAWGAWYGRRSRRQLAELDRLRDELRQGGPEAL
ncbi:MAG TPA: hypothetical protein VJ803_03700 [Gemmatimonadaceae bacterium]|nr:hypothetical protein [Gemmatimonadaceae bacterium]